MEWKTKAVGRQRLANERIPFNCTNMINDPVKEPQNLGMEVESNFGGQVLVGKRKAGPCSLGDARSCLGMSPLWKSATYGEEDLEMRRGAYISKSIALPLKNCDRACLDGSDWRWSKAGIW